MFATCRTKYSATVKIAEKIAVVIEDADVAVDSKNVNHIKSVREHHAIILGSALTMGFWRQGMTRFVHKNTNVLAQK